jgi:RNA polymerase sigma factor (sigma-70 family)
MSGSIGSSLLLSGNSRPPATTMSSCWLGPTIDDTHALPVTMDDRQWLAVRFEENRAHLLAVAHRMLGSRTDAEDAVQDTWLRLSRSDATAIESLRGWLTTAVARSCFNILERRRGRREQRCDPGLLELLPAENGTEPEQQAVEADSIGVALLVVRDCLGPAERVAFVLHDAFAVPFEEIALVVSRSLAAARQLASRARRRVQAATPLEPGFRRERELVTAFLPRNRGVPARIEHECLTLGSLEFHIRTVCTRLAMLSRLAFGSRSHSTWR